ncbi:MAG: citramalate synthase [Desulfofustis sp. PB-SRB1]|jgi:2-isopropylmalate synthase|nr:citramalate synthase [Desulfofustis sp. PB-SRB1]MBM1002948.1 citramalate synthase [Desulfofustis sp. PB-SRB1]HBH27321.1 citramalate synthase [Desulfofustis sp.]
MTPSVEIYDTTLRDGTQAENFNLSAEDKIRITFALDELGIDCIEGGWPGANPKSADYFNLIKGKTLRHARIAAFGATRHIRHKPHKDPNLQALIAAETPIITIFGKSWPIHVTDALQITLAENLGIIEDTLSYLKEYADRLIYDAEHFFDGFKHDQEYALTTLEHAVRGGATTIVLCDTNGGTLPHELAPIIETVKKRLAANNDALKLGIHTHNDAESAVANSLIAVEHGIKHIQGTINGFGERCGNANLTSIIPALIFKMKRACTAADHIEQLYKTSRLVNEMANLPHNRYQPYVGESAFAHKGGIHVSAVQRNPLTYEHIAPEQVGNNRRILVSEQSGRANILHKAQKWGLTLKQDDPLLASIISELKDKENQGYTYEAAEASFELLMRGALGLQRKFFRVDGFRVMNNKYRMDQPPLTEATIRLYVGGNEVHTASMGDGPVNALDRAMRKALTRFYPCLEEMELMDYKVRVLSGEHGTEAKVRVLVESADKDCHWRTVGVSVNIIEASWQALVDSVNFKLMKEEHHDATR